MSLKLPAALAEKIVACPRAPAGLEATLVLKDGRKVFGAIFSERAELVSIDDIPVRRKQDLDFGMTDIIDVLPGP